MSKFHPPFTNLSRFIATVEIWSGIGFGFVTSAFFPC